MADQTDQFEERLIDNILYPFRQFGQTYEFVSRTEAASVTITLVGILASRAGYSPGITSAVGAIGLASAVTELALRVIYNRDVGFDALKERLSVRKRGLGVFIQVALGFGFYFIAEMGAINNLSLATFQFSVGLIIAFIAGSVYMHTYSLIQDGDNPSIRTLILFPMLASIGFMYLAIMALPTILSFLDANLAIEILQQEPGSTLNATNQTNTSAT